MDITLSPIFVIIGRKEWLGSNTWGFFFTECLNLSKTRPDQIHKVNTSVNKRVFRASSGHHQKKIRWNGWSRSTSYILLTNKLFCLYLVAPTNRPFFLVDDERGFGKGLLSLMNDTCLRWHIPKKIIITRPSSKSKLFFFHTTTLSFSHPL